MQFCNSSELLFIKKTQIQADYRYSNVTKESGKKLPVLTGDENSVVRYKLCWIMRNKDSFNSRQRILLCVRPVKRFDIGVRRVFQSYKMARAFSTQLIPAWCYGYRTLWEGWIFQENESSEWYIFYPNYHYQPIKTSFVFIKNQKSVNRLCIYWSVKMFWKLLSVWIFQFVSLWLG